MISISLSQPPTPPPSSSPVHLSNTCAHDSCSYLHTLHSFSSSSIQYLQSLTPSPILNLTILFHLFFFFIFFRYSGSPSSLTTLYQLLYFDSTTFLHLSLYLVWTSSPLLFLSNLCPPPAFHLVFSFPPFPIPTSNTPRSLFSLYPRSPVSTFELFYFPHPFLIYLPDSMLFSFA